MMRGFAAVDAVLQDHVASGVLPGVSYAVLRGADTLAEGCFGFADREAGTPLRRNAIFRAYSNTKLVTSVAVLRLHDAGHFGLDDPVADWLPALRQMRVLAPGAQTLDDSRPAERPITIRHLLTHTAGFSHGVFDPGTLLFEAYNRLGIRRWDSTLAEEVDILAGLPLQFQPGSVWDYSAATDVLARLVELVSGQAFGDHLQQHLFASLGMVDTGFVLTPEQQTRFTTLYGVPEGENPGDHRPPATRRLDAMPFAGAWREPRPRQSGAGGLFTSLPDMLALLRALLPGAAPLPDGRPLLAPATLAAMATNQLAPGQCVHFAHTGPLQCFGFGLAGAVTVASGSDLAPPGTEGLLQWGGLAGTHWWLDTRRGIAGALMAQRMMGFWQPYWFDFQRGVYAALG